MLVSILIFLIFALLVYIFYLSIVKSQNYWKDRGVVQANPPWLFGESFKGVLKQESFAESIDRIYNTFPHKRYFGTYQFITPIIVIRDPELIKRITIKDFDHFVNHRQFIPPSIDPLWGNNLFSLQGQKWKEMRMILSPAFTSSKMKNMFKCMMAESDKFVNFLESKKENIIELDVKDKFSRFTCDVIISVALGIELDTLNMPSNEFYEAGKEFTDFTGWRSLLFLIVFIAPLWIIKVLGFRVFSERVSKFFVETVERSIKIREEKQIIRKDLINLLMEARKGRSTFEDEITVETGYATAKTSSYFANKTLENINISSTDVAAQALIFFFGGFDTTATAMRFMAYELAVYPDVQNKLRKEIIETYESCQGNVTYENIMTMNYLDMVVSELMRKWPNGIVLERICNKPYTIPAEHPEENDVTLPVGTPVWIPAWGIHRDPKYYPNPEKFDPERFSSDNRNNIIPYTYLPFGEGPRNCIGSRYALLNMKVLFFQLLRKFEIVPVEKSKIPIKISRQNFTLDGDGFWFGMKRL